MPKIYAVKDRLLDYLMSPVIAESDKAVQSSLAAVINTEGSTHAIAQAPKDFDLYQLGQITDEGQVYSDYRIICNCAGLVRSNLRNGGASADAAVSQSLVEREAPTGYGGTN